MIPGQDENTFLISLQFIEVKLSLASGNGFCTILVPTCILVDDCSFSLHVLDALEVEVDFQDFILT